MLVWSTVSNMGLAIDLYLIVFYNIHILGKIVMVLGLFKTLGKTVMILGLFKTYQRKEKLADVIKELTNRIKDLGELRDVWLVEISAATLPFPFSVPILPGSR